MTKEKLDKYSLGVAVVYVVQMEGNSTIKEIYDDIVNKMGFNTTEKAIRRSVEAARKRDLLSIGYDEDRNPIYSLKRAGFQWSNPPEMPQIKATWSDFVVSEESKEVRTILEGGHMKGATKGKGPVICDYERDLPIKYETLIPILGGEFASKDKGVFRRLNGSVWLPMNLWLRGALKLKLRIYNANASQVQYIVADNIFIKESEAGLIDVSVMTPRGLMHHEALDVGTILETRISFPTKGFLPKDTFLKCLDKINIGAKHKEYGLLKLVEPKV